MLGYLPRLACHVHPGRDTASPPSPACAGDAQEVQIVDQRLSRYNPLPVTIRNDDAIRVKCVD